MRSVLLVLVSLIPAIGGLLQGDTNPSNTQLLQMLQTMNQTMQKQNQQIQFAVQENELAKQQIAVLLQENKVIKQQIAVIQAAQQVIPKNVAFTASLDSHTQLGDKQEIDFGHLITNIGNGYNERTGIFTAPVKGVYFFIVNYLTHDQHSLDIQLVKNGLEILHGYSSSTGYDGSSTAAVVELEVGDVVWVRHKAGIASQEIHGGGYSSFTGFLIK